MGQLTHTTQEVENDIARVWPKEEGNGIRVDPDSPSYPWFDLEGPIIIRTGGANRPSLATYIGGIEEFQFSVGDLVDHAFHVPHDYVPNSDLYLHVHWSHNSAGSPTGTVTWEHEITYAKGHDQMAFITPITVTNAQAANSTQYQHMIAEIPITQSGAGALIDNTTIEADGMFIVKTKLLSSTLPVEPFGHFVDMHYQSTSIGTKEKAPPFYGA